MATTKKPTKKAPAKKAPVKKTATKAPAKKTTTKKAPAKASKKASNGSSDCRFIVKRENGVLSADIQGKGEDLATMLASLLHTSPEIQPLFMATLIAS